MTTPSSLIKVLIYTKPDGVGLDPGGYSPPGLRIKGPPRAERAGGQMPSAAELQRERARAASGVKSFRISQIKGVLFLKKVFNRRGVVINLI